MTAEKMNKRKSGNWLCYVPGAAFLPLSIIGFCEGEFGWALVRALIGCTLTIYIMRANGRLSGR